MSTPPDDDLVLVTELSEADVVIPNTVSSDISTTFHPDARLLHDPPDIILIACDMVLFYAHSATILSSSSNRLGFSLPVDMFDHSTQGCDETVVSLPLSSSVLNVILHVIYDRPCSRYNPTLDVLASAVDAMATYGISPKEHVVPSKQLFSLILGQAPINPIYAYALAAFHDLSELAVQVSNHLLSFSLESLTRELALKIGPIYLKKLFFLHFGRLEALRRMLLPPPPLHLPTVTCGWPEQKKLTGAWTLASACAAWDARPDLPASVLEATLGPLSQYLSCDVCKRNLAARIKQLVVQWSMVKRSI